RRAAMEAVLTHRRDARGHGWRVPEDEPGRPDGDAAGECGRARGLRVLVDLRREALLAKELLPGVDRVLDSLGRDCPVDDRTRLVDPTHECLEVLAIPVEGDVRVLEGKHRVWDDRGRVGAIEVGRALVADRVERVGDDLRER